MQSCNDPQTNKGMLYIKADYGSVTEQLDILMHCSSPASNGDLLDGVVSVSLVDCRFSGVVLSTHMDPDLAGMYHLL